MTTHPPMTDPTMTIPDREAAEAARTELAQESSRAYRLRDRLLKPYPPDPATIAAVAEYLHEREITARGQSHAWSDLLGLPRLRAGKTR